MKTIISYIAAVMLVSISFTANGQQVQSKSDRAKMETHGLKKQLLLTDAQVAQCEQIIKKYVTQLSDTKQAKSDSTQTLKTKQQLVKKRNNEIKALLTPAQQSKFEKWMQKKQEHRGKAMVKDSI